MEILEDGSTSPDRQVFVDFKPRDSTTCSPHSLDSPCEFSVAAEPLIGFNPVTGLFPGLPQFEIYQFNIALPSLLGVSSFNVRIQDKSTTIVETNGGSGFPLNDAILPQVSASSVVVKLTPLNFPGNEINNTLHLIAAVSFQRDIHNHLKP
jgi:hypothetical protein